MGADVGRDITECAAARGGTERAASAGLFCCVAASRLRDPGKAAGTTLGFGGGQPWAHAQAQTASVVECRLLGHGRGHMQRVGVRLSLRRRAASWALALALATRSES